MNPRMLAATLTLMLCAISWDQQGSAQIMKNPDTTAIATAANDIAIAGHAGLAPRAKAWMSGGPLSGMSIALGFTSSAQRKPAVPEDDATVADATPNILPYPPEDTAFWSSIRRKTVQRGPLDDLAQ